jgi:hypothetical protein
MSFPCATGRYLGAFDEIRLELCFFPNIFFHFNAFYMTENGRDPVLLRVPEGIIR